MHWVFGDAGFQGIGAETVGARLACVNLPTMH